MRSVAAIGAGSYSTGVVVNQAYQHPDTDFVIYARSSHHANSMNSTRQNLKYFDYSNGYRFLPNNVRVTSDLEDAVKGSDVILLGVPAQQMRSVTREVAQYIDTPTSIISLAKGLEKGTLKRMSQVMYEECKNANHNCDIFILSGPSFASTLMSTGGRCAVTLAGRNYDKVKKLQSFLCNYNFDVKSTRDLVGVELGGATKNIFAIMAGMISASECGESMLGDYIPRSLVEMRTIGLYKGAYWRTFEGRSGLGDLIISSTMQSRNFRFGHQYAKNFAESGFEKMDYGVHLQVLDKTLSKLGASKTVEGFSTIEPVFKFVDSKNMFAPIVRELHAVFYSHIKTPLEAIRSFREQDAKYRTSEYLSRFSRAMLALFPKVWYRRHEGYWSRF